MIRSLLYADGKVREGLSPEEMRRARSGDGVLWVDMDSPTPGEAAILDDVFAFHPLTIEDCLDPSFVPKLDDYGDYLFLTVLASDRIRPEQGEPAVFELALYLSKSFVVSFHQGRVEGLEKVHAQARSSPRDVFGKGADFVLHAILDSVVDRYFDAVRLLDEAAEALEDEVVASPDKRVFERVMSLRSHVLQLRRFMTDEARLIETIEKGGLGVVGEEVRPYFSDVQDHFEHLVDRAEATRDTISNARDLYLSTLNMRTSEIMRVLAILATVVLPLSLVAEIYGMNFSYLPWASRPWGFLAVMGATAAVAAGLLTFFRWKRWL